MYYLPRRCRVSHASSPPCWRMMCWTHVKSSNCWSWQMLNVKYKRGHVCWPHATTLHNLQFAICSTAAARCHRLSPSLDHYNQLTLNKVTNWKPCHKQHSCGYKESKKQTQQQLSRVKSCRKLRGIFLCGFRRQYPPQKYGDLLKIEAIRGQVLRLRIGRYIYICIGRPRHRHMPQA